MKKETILTLPWKFGNLEILLFDSSFYFRKFENINKKINNIGILIKIFFRNKRRRL